MALAAILRGANLKTVMKYCHPGETLREDFLKPLRMSVNQLALELRVPATRLMESFMAAEALLQIRRSGWHVILIRLLSSG